MDAEPYLLALDIHAGLLRDLVVGHLLLLVEYHTLLGEDELRLASVLAHGEQACIAIEGSKTGTVAILHALGLFLFVLFVGWG